MVKQDYLKLDDPIWFYLTFRNHLLCRW